MASYKTKIARLNALLDAHGICAKCGELYEHTYDEPFASCKCGCSEWYKLTPHMQLVQKLHAEIAELQRWKLEQLQTWDKVDTFARKYTRLGASVAAVALELMKRGVQLPIPAPAVSAANPVQWLEDEGDMILVPRGLLGAACSSIDKQRPAPKVLEAMRHYTMNAPQASAVPTNTIPEGDDFNGTTPHMIRCIESLVSMNDRGALSPHGLCGHSRTLLLASANRLRQQQAHVVPAVPELDPMTRLIVSDPKQPKPTALQAPAVPDEHSANADKFFVQEQPQ